MIRVESLNIELPGFAVRDVSLSVEEGGFHALMGPTGSGKTLVLESIAGLMPATSGRILLDGTDVTALPPEQRRVGIVYQDHALFPHLSLLDNVTYGQRYHGIPPMHGRERAMELLDMLGLADKAGRGVAKLSGGEKQRTAIARALAVNPRVLLLDEPLSALDPLFRDGLRQTLKDLHKRLGTTILMVTHDFTDALTLADCAALIRNGRIEQQGAVEDIFNRPVTPFAARFVGMRNLLEYRCDNGHVHMAGAILPNLRRLPTGSTGIAALRPEHLTARSADGTPHPDSWLTFQGTLRQVIREGFNWLAVVDCGGTDCTCALPHAEAMVHRHAEGTPMTIGFRPDALHFIHKS